MLSFLSPLTLTLIQLVLAEPLPRLERTAQGDAARRFAASVLLDADALLELSLVDHAALIEVELAGERHELRVELDPEGDVIGVALWWLGASDGEARHDLVAALPALEEAGTLDAITVDDGAVSLVAGGMIVPIAGSADEEDEDLEDVDGDGDEEWGC
jgi:hypothetical protein